MLTLSIHPHMLMGMPNSSELIVTLLIIVVLFGGKKIPEVAQSLGRGIREFNEAKDGIKNEIESGGKEKGQSAGPTGATNQIQ